MITLRPAQARGRANHGWLDSHHTFSFANYHDPKHMGFRALRVINEDRVAGGKGFGAHPHRDMEIISYVLEGALEHRDSLGTGSVIRPGDVQRMSAGTGVTHSEQNASRDEPVHFLQIWLVPGQRGIAPSYEQKHFEHGKNVNAQVLQLVASPDGRDGSLTVHADVSLHVGVFEAGQVAKLPLMPGRHAWVQVTRGKVEVNGQALSAGDGAALSDEAVLEIDAINDSELLAFDLA